MADGNKSNGNPYGTFDWKQFEQFFGGKLPFAPGGSGKGEGLAWIQEYVQDVMKQALPSVSNLCGTCQKPSAHGNLRDAQQRDC